MTAYPIILHVKEMVVHICIFFFCFNYIRDFVWHECYLYPFTILTANQNMHQAVTLTEGNAFLIFLLYIKS